MSSVQRRPTGIHHGNLRPVLLRAALELVAEGGPRGLTLAEVSRRAGVSVAAPYRHFADRDALLAELALEGYRTQLKVYGSALAEVREPAGQIAAFARAYVRFAVEHRAYFEVMFSAGLDKTTYTPLADAGSAVLALLTAPAAAFAPSADAAREIILSVAAAAHGMSVFLLEGVFDARPGQPGAAREVARTCDRAATAAIAIVRSASVRPDHIPSAGVP